MFANIMKAAKAGLSAVKSACGKAQTLAVTAATGIASALGLAGATTDAHADVPAIVGTTVTALQADAENIFTTVFPFVAAIIGMVIVLKLFKRFVNKA